MKTSELEELQADWIAASRGDDLGLFAVVRSVRERLRPGASWDLVRSISVEALAPLLRSGQLVAVDLLPAGEIAKWRGTPDEWLERIDSEWRALGRDPTISEIAWFYGPADAESSGSRG